MPLCRRSTGIGIRQFYLLLNTLGIGRGLRGHHITICNSDESIERPITYTPLGVAQSEDFCVFHMFVTFKKDMRKAGMCAGRSLRP